MFFIGSDSTVKWAKIRTARRNRAESLTDGTPNGQTAIFLRLSRDEMKRVGRNRAESLTDGMPNGQTAIPLRLSLIHFANRNPA
jgi:hypothetical protein